MGAKITPDLQMILSEIRQLRDELRTVGLKRLLSVDEAARYLGVAAKTVRNGLGPRATKTFPVKPVRACGRVMFRREDLDAFIDGLGTSE